MTPKPNSTNSPYSTQPGMPGDAYGRTPSVGGDANTWQSPSDGTKAKAQDVAHQAREKATEIKDQVKDQAREKVNTHVSQQKDRAAEGLGTVANALRQTGHNLREQDGNPVHEYMAKAADSVERLSGYLQNKSVGEIVSEVEGIARREPALFLGGAFALGLLGARFLKSSGQPQGRMSSPRDNYYSGYSGYRDYPARPYPEREEQAPSLAAPAVSAPAVGTTVRPAGGIGRS